jgi:hypothetical protein
MQAPRTRNIVLLALWISVSLVGGSVEAGEAPPEIPLVIPSPELPKSIQVPRSEPATAELPAWVSARAIRPEKGSLANWELIPPHYRRSYENADRNRLKEIDAARYAGDAKRAVELASCPETPTKFFRSNHSRRNSSLKDLVLYSEAIYRGTLRARDFGFVQGMVGSLLLVEIEETLKAPENRPVPSQLFFEYPFADFRIGEMLFCLRPDRAPAVPEVGDSVLLFVLFPPTDRGLVIDSRSEEILFESSEGALSLPVKFRSDPSTQGLKSLAEAEKEIARISKMSPGRNGGVR